MTKKLKKSKESVMMIFASVIFISFMADGISFSGAYFRPTVVAIVVCLSLMALRPRKYSIQLDAKNVTLYLFVSFFLANSALQSNDKTFSYVIAYILIFFGLLIGVRSFLTTNFHKELIYKACFITAIVYGIFSIVEFLSYWGTGFNIQSGLAHVRFEGREAQALESFVGWRVKRSYGLADEPTLFAIGLLINALLGWLFCKNLSWQLRCVYVVMVATALFFTFSTALYVAVIISFCITQIRYLKMKSIINIVLLIFIVSVVLLNIEASDFNFLNKLWQITTTKRFKTFMGAFDNFSNHPLFGLGPGSTSSSGGNIISWYGMMMSENGIIGSVILFLYFCFHFRHLRIPSPDAKIVFFCSISTCVFLLTNAVFFFPALWLPFIISDIIQKR